MPYKSIGAAKKAGFPTSAEGIALTLAQINKLAEIYDAVKKAGTAKNPFSVAWTQWKRLYEKKDDRWTEIKTASIQFGAEQFIAYASREVGIPEHAIQIEGRLIHLNTKNLAEWGVTKSAADQIIQGIKGVPIRACKSLDPHECDLAFDNQANIGYGVHAWVEDDWIWAAAAITDTSAVQHIEDGTWTPFGRGNWSVAGIPTETGYEFEKTGLISGYCPTGISIVFSPAVPAFIGSGFDMVVAAITDHRGDTLTENTPEDGGQNPVTYTQEDLDIKIKEALETQKTESAAEAKKLADAELAKQHASATETLAKQKLEYDAALEKLSIDDRAAFDAKLADMTPTVDVEKMIAAAVSQGQADTLHAIEKDKLITEYSGMLTASVVLGAPYMIEGVLDPMKVDEKLSAMKELKVAAIAGIVDEAKMMVAAATPAQSAFDAAQVAGQAPGTDTQEAQDIAAITELRESTGRL